MPVRCWFINNINKFKKSYTPVNHLTPCGVYLSERGRRSVINNYIRQHGKRLYGLCLRLCANLHDADDLYQESWLKAMRSIERYDPAMPFEPWIARICVNTHKNVLRSIARSPLLNFSSNEEKERVLLSTPAPEEKDYQPLYDAIERLPDKLRIHIYTVDLENLNK